MIVTQWYEESVSDGGGGFVALGFIILFIIVFVIARRNGTTNIGHGGSSVADAIFWSSILGGGRSHGGGFSGGGFSGGFGGGFGGGSFGGGGAGGSW